MLKDILAISGQSGLFKLVAQAPKNIIVEQLQTKKRLPVYQTTKVSALDDIAIYTEDEEVPLFDILKKIFSIENKAVSSLSKTASNDEVKEYFEDILPTYDKERVYVSDMKKVISWYNILIETGILAELIDAEKKAETEKAEDSAKPNEDKKAVEPKAKKTVSTKKQTTTTKQPQQKPQAKKAKTTTTIRKTQ